MPELLIILIVVLLVAVLALLVALWLRPASVSLSAVETRLASIESGQSRFDGVLQAFATQLGTGSESTERRMDALRTAGRGPADRAAGPTTPRSSSRCGPRWTSGCRATLETRLGESFRAVSERLEQVHRGLGEMQALASGVGDLKKVLTNVKTRGTWGEVQLGSLLEQVLAPGAVRGQRRDQARQRRARRVRDQDAGARAETTPASSGCRSTRSSRRRTTSV